MRRWRWRNKMNEQKESLDSKTENEPEILGTEEQEVLVSPKKDELLVEIEKVRPKMQVAMDELTKLAVSIKTPLSPTLEEGEPNKGLSSELKKQIDSLALEFNSGKESVARIKEKISEIRKAKPPLDDPAHLFEDLRQRTLTLDLLIGEGRKISANLIKLSERLERLRVQYKQKKLEEIGIKQGEDVGHLNTRKKIERKKASGFMGFKALWNRKEIKKLDNDLGELNDLTFSSSTPRIYDYELLTQNDIDWTISDLAARAREGVNSLSSRVSESLWEERIKVDEVPKILSPEQITGLEDDYMKKYIDPELEKLRGPNVGQFNDEEYQALRGYIRRSLSIPKNIYYSTPSSQVEKIIEFRAEVETLDYSFRNQIESHQPRELLGDNFQKIALLMERLGTAERADGMEDLVNDFNQRDLRLQVSLGASKPYLLSFQKHESIGVPAKEVDVEEFRLIAQNPITRQFFGEEKIQKAEVHIKRKLIQDIYKVLGPVDYDKNEAYKIGSKLLKFGGAENTLVILLNSFRETGYSGENPFISGQGYDNALLGDFIKNLSLEEIKKLKEQNIPGFNEILDLVRKEENLPEIFLSSRIGEAKEKRKALHENLAKILEHQLKIGDPEMNYFLISLAERIDSDLGESYGIFKSILNNNNVYQIQRMAENRMKYNGDFKSLELLTHIQAFSRSDNRGIYRDQQRQNSEIEMSETFLYFFENIERFEKINILLSNFGEEKREEVRVLALKSLEMAAKNGIEINTESPRAKLNYIILYSKLGFNVDSYEDFLTSQFLEETYFGSNSKIVKGLLEMMSLNSLNLSLDNASKICVHIEKLALDNMMQEQKEAQNILNMLHEKNFVGEEQYQKTASLLRLTNGDSRKELEKQDKVTEENWSLALLWYTAIDGGLHAGEETQKKILGLFSNAHPDHRSLCLDNLRRDWINFLETKKLSPDAAVISLAAERFDGVGDLKYIESLAQMIFYLNKYYSAPKSSDKVKEKLFTGLASQEERFEKERWGEDDKAAFYSISKDIMAASPALYADYLDLISQLNPKELKIFAKDFFGTHQAMMVVLDKGGGKYSGRELLPLRKQIRSMVEKISAGQNSEEILREERNNTIEFLKSGFVKRFGITTVPENFEDNHIRTLQNFIRFAANINGKDNKKEAMLALYMSLMLNGEWQKFRQGQDIDISKHISGPNLELLRPVFADRNARASMDFEALGVPAASEEEFMQILQEDTIESSIGNVETIDIKLGNIKRAMEDLGDPDAYEHEEDKKLMILYEKYGKDIGTTLAKLYTIANKGKGSLEPELLPIQNELAQIYKIEKWDTASVKRIQEETRAVGLVSGVLQKIKEEDIDMKISDLRGALFPTDEIIAIFGRLDEDFKPTSGAMALNEDLAYLENIIVKNQDKLTEAEKAVLDKYLNDIREKMKLLEPIQDRLKEYFEKIKKSIHGSKKTRLGERVGEIEQIVYSKQEAVNVVSRITGDMNTVIENIRQCLGCLTSQCNNDTNLTFGEPYKFFAVSQIGEQKGSVADQIIMFVPRESPEGEKSMTFVMDTVYGIKSADILTANIKALDKKIVAIKKKFPNANISITVTNATLQSVGLSPEIFMQRYKGEHENTDLQNGEIKINIPTSKLGDNYAEYGVGGTRPSGELILKGITI